MVEEDCYPTVVEVSLNRGAATSESCDDALDISSCGDITGKNIELIIFFRDERFQSVRLLLIPENNAKLRKRNYISN